MAKVLYTICVLSLGVKQQGKAPLVVKAQPA
jgi:hypothetical protein